MLPDCFECKYAELGHPCRTAAGAFDFAKVAAGILALGRAYDAVMDTDGEPEVDESLAWVTDCEYETIEDHPQLLVPLIAAAMDMCATGRDAAFLAAGLIENALVKHGPKIIVDLEVLAARNAKARFVLSGVWSQNGSVDATVWKRLAVAVAAGPVMSVDDARNPGFGLPEERLVQDAGVMPLLACKLAL